MHDRRHVVDRFCDRVDKASFVPSMTIVEMVVIRSPDIVIKNTMLVKISSQAIL